MPVDRFSMIYRAKQKLDMGPAPFQPVFDKACRSLRGESQAPVTKRIGFASSDQHAQRTVWPELYVLRSQGYKFRSPR